jgi:segregation and condensation protein B
VLRALLERRLVKIVGKKDEPGRPLLYGTTTEFLETFSLPNLRSMPTLRDLEALRAEEATRTAGERQMDLSLIDEEPQSAQPPSSDSSSSEGSSNGSATPPESAEPD